MEARVAGLLVDRCKRGEPPVDTRKILKLLELPKTSKSEVNRLLYKTFGGTTPPVNLLRLPSRDRLVRRADRTPQWSVVADCTPDILAKRGALVAWQAYAMRCEAPNTTVDVAALLPAPDAASRDALLAKMREYILTPHEPVVPVDETSLAMRINDTTPDITVELDCDAIVGQNRDQVRCVLLGMAILDCVNSNRPKKIVLTTRNPGTLAVLRNVLKTDEGARSLNISVEDQTNA